MTAPTSENLSLTHTRDRQKERLLMQITVYMLAFGDIVPPPERIVDIPDVQARDLASSSYEADKQVLLELVFMNGQNDFQPKPIRSVSVGDVVRLPDESLHRVLGTGWEALPSETDITTLERGVACSLF